MNGSHRYVRPIAGLVFGALLAPAVISLLASPLAGADPTTDITGDVVTLGPYPIDGYTETLGYNTVTSAFDNYLTGTYSGVGFDLDTYFGPPGSDSFEVLLTDPGVVQLGVDDIGGSISYIDNFLGIDFLPTDPGLALLG